MSTLPSSVRIPGFALRPPRAPSVRVAVGIFCILVCLTVIATVPTAGAPTFDDDDLTVADEESWIGIEDEHAISIEATDIDTTDGPATVSIDLSEWGEDAIESTPEIEIETSGVELVDSETNGAVTTFEVNDTDEAIIDLSAEIETTLDHPLESSLDGAEHEIAAEIADANGSAAANAEITLKRLSYEVDGEERFPPSTEFVFRNQTVTATNLTPGASYMLFEFDVEEEKPGEPIASVDHTGSTAAIDTSDESLESGWYVVYKDGEIAPVEANAFRIQPHQLEASHEETELDSVGDGAETTVEFDSPLRTTAFDVNVTSPELTADELFDVFEGDENADIERVDGSETTIRIEDVTAGAEVLMTFEPVGAATYEFEFEAADTNASDATSVAVEEREIDAEFGSDVFETQAGEIVEVDVSFEDTDGGYVMIGGDRTGDDRTLSNYFDILHAEGDATIRLNTRLLGTNAPSEDVYDTDDESVTSYLQDPGDEAFDDVTFEGEADDIEAFQSEIGIDPLPRPLQPDRYRLVAGSDGSIVVRDDGVPDFERPLDRSNLLITDTDGFGNVTTYVAPSGSANAIDDPEEIAELTDELTERRTVAKGDRLVFEIEARGITGVVSWLADRMGSNGEGVDPSTLATLLEFPDGLEIDGEQTNPDVNERVTELDIDGASDGELYLLPGQQREDDSARYVERYYLVVDTREAGPFDREPRPGDEFRFRVGYNSTGEPNWFETVDHDALDPNGAPPHFPYADSDATNRTETRDVTIEESTVEYDPLDGDDRPIVRNAENGTLSGETNLAPGTETTIQLVAENRTNSTRISSEPVEIGSNGTFNVTRDFSAFEPNEAIEVEFYADQRLVDKRAARIVDARDELVEYRVAEHPDRTTVSDGESERIVVAVDNGGVIADSQTVELTLDGESVGDRSVALEGGERTTAEFDIDAATLEPGEYDYTVTTDDDEASGRLLVEEADTERDDEGSGSDDGGDEVGDGEDEADDEIEEPTGSEDSPDEGDGPFGVSLAPPVGARHAIGGAAVVGAIHVLGHWG